MNQFHEAALDRQEDRELRRDMADPVFVPSRDFDSAEPYHIFVTEHSGKTFAAVRDGNNWIHVVGHGWGSCAAASIREVLKA